MPLRPADRILEYLAFKGLNPHEFEKACQMANGYLKKQIKGRGSIGSGKLEHIREKYPDLNIDWLLTGNGRMILSLNAEGFQEEMTVYFTAKDEIIQLLRQQILLLEATINDKNRIISLLESRETMIPSPDQAVKKKKQGP